MRTMGNKNGKKKADTNVDKRSFVCPSKKKKNVLAKVIEKETGKKSEDSSFKSEVRVKSAYARMVKSVRGHHENEKVECEDLMTMNFHGPVATVFVSNKMTINLGNYESATVEYGVSLPCYSEEIGSMTSFAEKFVTSRMEFEIGKIRSPLGHLSNSGEKEKKKSVDSVVVASSFHRDEKERKTEEKKEEIVGKKEVEELPDGRVLGDSDQLGLDESWDDELDNADDSSMDEEPEEPKKEDEENDLF